ncbi:hypothetical protein SO802_017051, partial [Lithocarpus litseifolius]
MPEVLPSLKERIKESSIDKSDEGGDKVSAASARVPVGFAIVAAYQFRWFVTQVLEWIQTILKLTWIRNTPCVGRLVDELMIFYKEAAMKRAHEEVRMHILQIPILLQ